MAYLCTDTGLATPGTIYGLVTAAGRLQVHLVWESGLRQRVRVSALRDVRRLEPGTTEHDDARHALARYLGSD